MDNWKAPKSFKFKELEDFYNSIMLEREKMIFHCLETLRKCGFSIAKSIMLTYGEKLLESLTFPIEVRTIVKSILDDEEKLDSSLDSFDKSVLRVNIDLSVLMLEGALNDYINKCDIDNQTWLIKSEDNQTSFEVFRLRKKYTS